MIKIVLDFEMNSFYDKNGAHSEIIQLCAIKCDEEFRPIQVLNTYIRTTHTVSKYITKLTGISAITLTGAPKFSTVIKQLIKLIGKPKHGIEFYSWGISDKQVLEEHLAYSKFTRYNPILLNNWPDIQQEISKDGKVKGRLSLSTLSTRLNISFQGKAHDAKADAIVLLKILQLRERNPKEYSIRLNQVNQSAIKSNSEPANSRPASIGPTDTIPTKAPEIPTMSNLIPFTACG